MYSPVKNHETFENLLLFFLFEIKMLFINYFYFNYAYIYIIYIQFFFVKRKKNVLNPKIKRNIKKEYKNLKKKRKNKNQNALIKKLHKSVLNYLKNT